MWVCAVLWSVVRCTLYIGCRAEHDAVVAEQMQSAEVVDREHDRLQTELKDEVSSHHLLTHQIARAMFLYVESGSSINAFNQTLRRNTDSAMKHETTYIRWTIRIQFSGTDVCKQTQHLERRQFSWSCCSLCIISCLFNFNDWHCA